MTSPTEQRRAFDAAMDTAPPPAKGKKLFNSGSVSKPDEDYDAEPSAADRGACDPIISAAPRAQLFDAQIFDAQFFHPCAAIVEEMVRDLKEEVKELAKTSWLYEANDPRANTRVKL